MESLLAATEQKDEEEILKALAKVEKVKDQKKSAQVQQNTKGHSKQAQNGSINLGRKTAKPAGGFTDEVENDVDQKKQKTDAELLAKDDSSSDMFQCENCGS